MLVLSFLLVFTPSCTKETTTPSTTSSSSGSNSGGSNNGCPTTSSCGCSGLNKTPCEQNYCCKWTVGSGCGCK